MDHLSRSSWQNIDAVDLVMGIGFACLVAGVAIRYDYALALIVFGIGLLLIGCLAMWRNA